MTTHITPKTQRRHSPVRALLLASAVLAATIGAGSLTPVYAEVPMAGFADLAAKVMPSVVLIEVTEKPKTISSDMGNGGPVNPFDEFMRRFGQNPMDPNGGGGGQAPDAGPVRALGSGFLISTDGEIVTNNHVVDGAETIKVKLQDGRSLTAHVVGTDPMTDVALIKLDKPSKLPPVVQLATDGKLRVGDAVVAIGNPFGLGSTVTSGIVSAMGRNINSGPYDNFIQTDAAINRGNSGGPLFNTAGEVVGMNTAIFSPSGGSVGIGFAIPSSVISNVIGQLRDSGHVSRGWLGVSIQPVTTDLAQALGLADTEGAIVAEVLPDGPAQAAKMHAGDVILAVNGQRVDDSHGLPTLIAAIPAGKAAELSILRDGQAKTVTVTIAALTQDKMQLASATDQSGPANTPLGVTVQSLQPGDAQTLGLPPDTKGLLVQAVAPDSPNGDRLLTGDVILEAAGQPVSTPEMLLAAIKDNGGNSSVLLKVERSGKPLYVGAEISAS